MRHFISILSFFFIHTLFAQNKPAQAIEQTLEETLYEADQLFTYRMMEWWSNDLISKNDVWKTQVADYIIYHDKHELNLVLIDSSYQNKIGSFHLDIDSEDTDIRIDSTKRPLNQMELNHYQVYQKMLYSISKTLKEKVEEIEGFWIGSIMIKNDIGYKLYLFSNTSRPNIIPLGNDAVFYADEQGKVLNQKWYHDGLIQIPISKEGKRISTHKHEKHQIHISPTEIANFRFYGLLYGMLQLPILVPEEGLLLEYNALENKIHRFYSK